MAGRSSMHGFQILLFLLLLSAMSHRSTAIRGAYYPSWLFTTFPPSSIPPSQFTHVFYAFIQPSPATSHLVITPSDESILTNLTTTLHSHQPPVKVLLSIGGLGTSPSTFASIASSPSLRSAFISSSIEIARKYNLDGFDLDWQFPQTPSQMSDLANLFLHWRHTFERESEKTNKPRLLLTAAVYFASDIFLSDTPRSYPAAKMGIYLDFVNVMCYDYHGVWDTSRTGLHAALFDDTSNISTSYGVSSWVAAGMPARKVVMGLPAYGRTWRLKDAAEHGVGSPATGVGPGSSDGTMVYSKVVDFNAAENATVVVAAAAAAAYSYVGMDWIGYDDPVSVARKIGFAKGIGLGGYFFWALGYDDKEWSLSKTASVTWGDIIVSTDSSLKTGSLNSEIVQLD